MKTLFFARHAKSAWDYPDLLDQDRPLLPKGIERTKLVCEFLLERGVSPDIIISSPAVRAINTARIIAECLHYPTEAIRLEPMIYAAIGDDLLTIAFGLDNSMDSAMIVGHNPVMTFMINAFAETGIDYLPTSGIGAFSFETDTWAGIPMAKCVTDFLIYPRLLKRKESQDARS